MPRLSRLHRRVLQATIFVGAIAAAQGAAFDAAAEASLALGETIVIADGPDFAFEYTPSRAAERHPLLAVGLLRSAADEARAAAEIAASVAESLAGAEREPGPLHLLTIEDSDAFVSDAFISILRRSVTRRSFVEQQTVVIASTLWDVDAARSAPFSAMFAAGLAPSAMREAFEEGYMSAVAEAADDALNAEQQAEAEAALAAADMAETPFALTPPTQDDLLGALEFHVQGPDGTAMMVRVPLAPFEAALTSRLRAALRAAAPNE